MASVNYNEIFSRFYTKVQAYDFLELDEQTANEFLCNWLHSVFSKPYIFKMFKMPDGILCDDENEVITYEMQYPINDFVDRDFIIEVVSIGMVIEWLEPKINSVTNLAQMFSSNESKWFSQSSHLNEMRNLKESLKNQQRNLISDRGYSFNSYLGDK